MANTKISALTADTAPTADDLVVTVNDPGGTPATKKATITNFTKAIPELIGDGGGGGTKGLAPAPASGDAAAGKFLKADGTWAVPSGTGAPTNATYITQTANGSLSNEQALGSLATGILKSTATTGVVSIATVDDINAPVFAQDAGANDTYTATLSPAPSSYVTGNHYRFKANTANTGACTIEFNSLGAKTIKKVQGGITTDLADNDIRAGQWVDLVYDGTNMQMQSTLGNAPSAGTIGGSTGSTDNAVLRADGTGGSTAQASNLTIPDDAASTEVGYLNIPQNSQSAAYTTVMADRGKHILHPSTDANARTFTIDSNANVAYPTGTAITFINMTSQLVTIAITSDTMYLAGTGTTGSRSLAQYGIATAIKIDSTHWIISGTGLT